MPLGRMVCTTAIVSSHACLQSAVARDAPAFSDRSLVSTGPNAFFGTVAATSWPVPARGAPRIKVHNGTVVVGTLPEANGGWLQLSGWQKGYWLPVCAGGMPVLHRVPGNKVQVGAWKTARQQKDLSHQRQLDAARKKAEYVHAQEQKRANTLAATAARRENRLELDEQAYRSGQDAEMEIAAIKIQSVQRGRQARKKMAVRQEHERRKREDQYEQIESATKIQAVFRGRRDRKKTSKLRVVSSLARAICQLLCDSWACFDRLLVVFQAAQLAMIHGMMAVSARPKPYIKRAPEATQAAKDAIEKALSGNLSSDGFAKTPPPAVMTSKMAVLPLPVRAHKPSAVACGV